MDFKGYADLVKRMRLAQARHVRDRSVGHMNAVIKLEVEVDQATREILSREPRLFDETADETARQIL